MRESIKKALNNVQNLLKNSEEYNNFEINYIIGDKENHKCSYAIASNNTEIISVNIENLKITGIPEWDFSADKYILGELEKGKIIAYMDMSTHYGIWCEIEESYPNGIYHKEGLQLYINYCKENNIYKKNIEKSINLKVADIMSLDGNVENQIEDKVYNDNLKILYIGNRRDEKIALVEKNNVKFGDKEFIVAFNYEVDKASNSLTWGYGYYYYDFESGKKAFNKVINGHSLSEHDR